jgi:O-antigen/teichoic acid export membrane protein
MSDSRVKKSAQNMAMGFIYQAVMLVLSFVSRTAFIHTLGDEYLGINATFADVLSLLSMADLGFGTAMAYSFYKPLAENDHRQVTALINFYKKIYTIIAGAVLILGLACVPFLKYIVNTDEYIPNLEIYYIISLLGIVVSYMFVYKTTLLTADQRDYEVVKVRTWTSVLKTVLQIVSLYIAKNYILYLVIGLATQVLNNLVASKKADSQYPYIKENSRDLKESTVDADIKKSLFENIKSVFIYKVSSTMFSATDNIIISIVVGTAITGRYSNYLMVSNKLLLIEQIVFSAMTASVGNIIVKETAKKRKEVFMAMQSASFIFCGIITSAFCLIINDLINVWLKSDVYVLGTITVVAITLNTYFSCVLQPLWIYRDATGIYKKTKYVMFAGAVVNIVLSFVLGSVMGLAGVIFASAIARLTTYFWYEPKILFREYFDSSAGGYYLSILKNALLVAVTVLVLGISLSGFEITGWLALIVKSVIVGVCCSVIFLVAYSKTEGFKIILDKAKNILARKNKEGLYGQTN